MYVFDSFDTDVPEADQKRIEDEFFNFQRISIRQEEGEDIIEEDSDGIFLSVHLDGKYILWYKETDINSDDEVCTFEENI